MLIGQIQINRNPFWIECTTHAIRRMSQRRIASWVVKDLLENVGDKLLLYNNTGEELAIVDTRNDITVIVQVRLHKAVVITVINRGEIYIKRGTRLEHIAC